MLKYDECSFCQRGGDLKRAQVCACGVIEYHPTCFDDYCKKKINGSDVVCYKCGTDFTEAVEYETKFIFNNRYFLTIYGISWLSLVISSFIMYIRLHYHNNYMNNWLLLTFILTTMINSMYIVNFANKGRKIIMGIITNGIIFIINPLTLLINSIISSHNQNKLTPYIVALVFIWISWGVTILLILNTFIEWFPAESCMNVCTYDIYKLKKNYMTNKELSANIVNTPLHSISKNTKDNFPSIELCNLYTPRELTGISGGVNDETNCDAVV